MKFIIEEPLDLIVDGIQAPISIITMVMIPVLKMHTPDKLPFFVTEWQFLSGYAEYSSNCMLNKKIFESIDCFIL